jgi:hypothetical protein
LLSISDIYGLQDAAQVSIHIAVPKPQHAKARARQLSVARQILVGIRLQIVMAAINFDDQGMLQANEINDEAFARRLTPEMKSSRSPGAQMIPDLHFLRCQRLPQAPSNLVCHTPPGSRFA